MGWNGSGSVTRSHDWTDDRDAGVKILASRHDTHDADLATAIAACLAKNGENSATAHLNIGGYRLKSVGTATALTDAPNATGIQNSSHVYAADGSTTANTHVLTLSPAVTSFVAGQRFIFKSGSTNTGAATLNVNGLGTKSLVKGVSTALVAGDITSGEVVEVVYDGTNFQIPTLGTGAISFTSITTTGDITVGDDVILDSDAAEIQLGDNQEVKIIHNHDKGIILKHTATADDKPVSLTLQTGETDIAADDVIGKIDFQAPDEGTGTDAILVAAGIEAVSEGDFSCSSNATSLVFKTGASEAAAAKLKITSAGHLVPASDNSVDLGTSSVEFKDAYFDGTVTSDAFAGPLSGNATTATALETARTIGGTSFDGSTNIAVALSATTTALASARTIGGVSFDGTANINLPGVNASGNQDTSGTAAIATAVTITDNESTNEDNAIIFTAGGDVDGGNLGLESDGTLTYNPSTGKVTATGFIGTLTGNVTGNTSGSSGSTTGNAATATALATGRTIAMTGDVAWTSASFDGSGNVTGSSTIQANSVDGTMLALGSDASGDVMYYNGTNYVRLGKGDDDQVLTLAAGVPSWAAAAGGGKVLQVVTMTSTTVTSTTSSTYVDTNLTLAITPASTSNHVLVFFTGTFNLGGTRGSWSDIALEVGGSEAHHFFGHYAEGLATGNFDLHLPISGIVRHSPSSTSATTYNIAIKTSDGTAKLISRGTGSLTLMEIAG